MINEKMEEQVVLILDELTGHKLELDEYQIQQTTLKELGISSLLLYSFITKLEDSFSIKFDIADLEPKHFKTVDSSVQILKKYKFRDDDDA